LFSIKTYVFFVKYIAVNGWKCAAIIYCVRHQFRRLSLAVEENDLFTVVRSLSAVPK